MKPLHVLSHSLLHLEDRGSGTRFNIHEKHEMSLPFHYIGCHIHCRATLFAQHHTPEQLELLEPKIGQSKKRLWNEYFKRFLKRSAICFHCVLPISHRPHSFIGNLHGLTTGTFPSKKEQSILNESGASTDDGTHHSLAWQQKSKLCSRIRVSVWLQTVSVLDCEVRLPLPLL